MGSRWQSAQEFLLLRHRQPSHAHRRMSRKISDGWTGKFPDVGDTKAEECDAFHDLVF